MAANMLLFVGVPDQLKYLLNRDVVAAAVFLVAAVSVVAVVEPYLWRSCWQ